MIKEELFFQTNFIIVTKDFMKQISLFNGEEKDKIEKYLFEIKFGNKFLIMKAKSSNVFLRYIILYEDILQKIVFIIILWPFKIY